MSNLIISGPSGVQIAETSPADAIVPGCNDADCSGECGGSAAIDECGTCDNNSSNDCVQDCSGEWGGAIEEDECGVCGGDNSTCSDCAGTPNGTSVADECGTCDADSSNDCVHDCSG